MEKDFLKGDEESQNGPYLTLFQGFNLIEKILYIAMNLVAGSIIPCLLLAMNPHSGWERPLLMGIIILFLVLYLVFKKYHFSRTKNKISLHFDPLFTWIRKRYSLF